MTDPDRLMPRRLLLLAPALLLASLPARAWADGGRDGGGDDGGGRGRGRGRGGDDDSGGSGSGNPGSDGGRDDGRDGPDDRDDDRDDGGDGSDDGGSDDRAAGGGLRDVSVLYPDGWTERVTGGTYEILDPAARLVVARPATAGDVARMLALR